MGNALEIGVTFAGRYRVVRCMAHGGMAAVYEVVHLQTDRRCALKIVHEHLLHSEAIVRRFQREAKIAARVGSDFVVDVFDAGVDPESQTPFLVMELLRGEELGRRIERAGPLRPDEVASYMHQTALALDKTHQAGVVHRDLKPENLFVSELAGAPPRIKVLDFGVAKIMAEAQAGGSTTLSAGTPRYMAPEQFDPYATITGAADIYALGLIAYTCLVGAPYWFDEVRARNIFAFAAIAKHGPSEPASVRAERRFGVRLPAGFDAWFAKAAHVDPRQRFESATAATDALRIVLNAPFAAAVPSLPTSTAPRSDRHRGRAALLVGAAALVLAVLGTARIHASSASPAGASEAASQSDRSPRAPADGSPARARTWAERVDAAMALADSPSIAARALPAEDTATSPRAPPPVEVAKKKTATTPTSRAATESRPVAPSPQRYTQE